MSGPTPDGDSHDYIVIGSGAGGGVVAARLSEDGRHRVLCLEAGTADEKYFWARPPTGSLFMFSDPKVNWCYYSEPDPSHGDRPMFVPRGKMLGGTTSINGMVYNRGQRGDYDAWAALGCPGWSYQDVLPYFKKIESTTIGSDQFRGRAGPIKVTEAQGVSRFFDLFMRAANAAGIPSTADYSGESQEGIAFAQQTVHRGQRSSTATAYLAPARRRPNLSIVTGAEATSLLMEGRRCVGVRYVRNGATHEVRARREVIVACGTANTPKLLELSGIGDPQVLRDHGIDVVHALPGVGENLRDHYACATRWRLNASGLSLSRQVRGWRLVGQILRYALTRTGMLTMVFGSVRAFTRSRPDLPHPDIMILAAPFIVEVKPGQSHKVQPIEGFYVNAHPQRTESTGSVHIRSRDPFAPPAIRYRFLQTEGDRATAIAAVRRMREVVMSPPLRDFIAEELHPGPKVQTDEDILALLRSQGHITHHMVGTCRMGQDALAVVDERLRVHGIVGLRIADASVMPTITSGNTAIPTMMIGERCADMVLADAGAVDEPPRATALA